MREELAGLDKVKKKIRYDLVPWREFEEVVKVIGYGADKYTDFGWKTVTNAYNEYLAAAERHQVAVKARNEVFDEESGLYHLAHAICDLMYAFWHQIEILELKERVTARDSSPGSLTEAVEKLIGARRSTPDDPQAQESGEL